jgi:hypothetical protein
VRAPTLVLAVLLAGCAAPLPHPSARDAALASARWPGASLESLEAGRRLFVFRCTGCHRLHRPQERAPEAWPEVLDDMEKQVHVSREERRLIEQFLVTIAADRSELARGAR